MSLAAMYFCMAGEIWSRAAAFGGASARREGTTTRRTRRWRVNMEGLREEPSKVRAETCGVNRLPLAATRSGARHLDVPSDLYAAPGGVNATRSAARRG